jgi:hypothetical protein
MSNTKGSIEIYNEEISREISNPSTQRALLATTFKGLEINAMKQAMLEGMMRGFSFKDFLEKNVYAIPFKGGYSLITSVDYARKVGMRSGVVGKSAPVYETDEQGNIISCEITIKKMIGEHIGEFTARVYFTEYYAGYKNPDGSIKKNNYGELKPNLWDTKPRTMIAKVAEMHALRMACPEELSQAYLEEEVGEKLEKENFDLSSYEAELRMVETLEDLKNVWATFPAEVKLKLVDLKDELKNKFNENK